MSSYAKGSASRPRAIPRSFLPVLSTSLNVGMALGGYITTIPFENPAYPGPAVALWFKDFFKPGFIGITVLGALTLGTGIRSFLTRNTSTSTEDIARQRAASRWSLAGVVFTVFHFGFGNRVLAIMDNILSSPETAQGVMASWVWLHVVRTLTTDVPAWLCFVTALLYEI